MKILFSPSEAKTAVSSNKFIDSGDFIFPNLYEKRCEILKIYDDFLQKATVEKISKLFGVKNLTDEPSLRESIFKKGAIKAVLRYDGVAYKHLDYRSLDSAAQEFIDKNTLIFSNLFGPVLAADALPEYKLKQGERIDGLNLEEFYRQNFSGEIDGWLGDDDILDLRAEFYEKFYRIRKPFATFKFLKNGKVVSHYAKAYRGIVLRQVAQKGVKNFDELCKMDIENLRLIDVKKTGPKSEFLVQIV
ncbi:YaaA family protein [uncultured Campylobacter sp.]|uniref:YaaA family protein n=1 Tax=uncultured Campylobacter sp. TaxID=218934 RepID=UPI0025EE143F|nr:YaaA family protein [uncultured Campylobacter sp.]